MDVNKTDTHKKKKAGAVGCGLAGILVLAAMIAVLIRGKISDPSMPTAVAVIYAAVLAGAIAAIIAVMRSRLKEIDGGEEDEASKY